MMMSNLDFFHSVLNNEFITNESFLEEPSVGMRIDFIKKGCHSFLFKFDKQLGKEYKGGLFPFFNCGEAGVCKKCDYIVFAEKSGKLYSLLIELKTGRSNVTQQLNAGECFVDYLQSTVNRVFKKEFILIVRKVAIKEYKRKNRTKFKDIEYNKHNIHEFSDKRFRLEAFLK